MADYPKMKLSEQKVSIQAGHKGIVKDSNIEGRAPEIQTIRKEGVKK